MHFTSDISIGTILTIVVLLGAFYRFHIANVTRIMKIEHRVETMWSAFQRRFNFNDDEEYHAREE